MIRSILHTWMVAAIRDWWSRHEWHPCLYSSFCSIPYMLGKADIFIIQSCDINPSIAHRPHRDRLHRLPDHWLQAWKLRPLKKARSVGWKSLPQNLVSISLRCLSLWNRIDSKSFALTYHGCVWVASFSTHRLQYEHCYESWVFLTAFISMRATRQLNLKTEVLAISASRLWSRIAVVVKMMQGTFGLIVRVKMMALDKWTESF